MSSYPTINFYQSDAEEITFHTMSGDLFTSRDDDYIVMDFPAYECQKVPVTEDMVNAFGVRPIEAYLDRDLLLVYEEEALVRKANPDFERISSLPGNGVGITAPGNKPGDKYDCVSRFFAPKLKVNEDPVTGSVHCMIVPYWAKRLGKDDIYAYQASLRVGELKCKWKGRGS